MIALAYAVAVLCAAPQLALAAPEDAEAARGTLRKSGCLACHTTDGNPHVGPTLRGLFGKTRRVLKNGAPRNVIADTEYLRRAIEEPDSEVVEGFKSGAMPRYSLDAEKTDALVDAIRTLGSETTPPNKAPWLWGLAISALAFVGLHLGLSSHCLRTTLTRRLGERRFQAVYSLLVLLPFVGLVVCWRQAPHIGLWSWPGWTAWATLLLMPLACILLVAGFTTKSPTLAGMGTTVETAEPAQGILKVTRHPALWGIALWGLAHLPPNGDVAALVLFGNFVVLAIAGMHHIDARRRATFGDAWVRFERVTSLVPFWALLRGRTRLGLRELGWARPLGGLLLYLFYLLAHGQVIGASPYAF